MRNALILSKRAVLTLSSLLERRFVFDDDFDVLHHQMDTGRQ